MDKEAVIKMLNADITGEIEAILTYLRHNFVIKECEISRVMEEISLDEMRHLEWLSETVTDLGGIPTIEHAELHLEGEDTSQMLKRDVGLEGSAIAQYQEHIDAITDPKIKRLLRKITNEEIEHREEFEDMLHEFTSTQEPSAEPQKADETPKMTVGDMKSEGESE